MHTHFQQQKMTDLSLEAYKHKSHMLCVSPGENPFCISFTPLPLSDTYFANAVVTVCPSLTWKIAHDLSSRPEIMKMMFWNRQPFIDISFAASVDKQGESLESRLENVKWCQMCTQSAVWSDLNLLGGLSKLQITSWRNGFGQISAKTVMSQLRSLLPFLKTGYFIKPTENPVRV